MFTHGVCMKVQSIEKFDLPSWRNDCITLPLVNGTCRLAPEAKLPVGDWFVKGHHSSKDLGSVKPCRTLDDIKEYVLKSVRVQEDNPKALFAVPWLNNLEQEARVFYHKGRVCWIRPASVGGWYPQLEDLPVTTLPEELTERCCADVGLLSDGQVVYLEVNPFDEDTDLYGVSYWEICGDTPPTLYPSEKI